MFIFLKILIPTLKQQKKHREMWGNVRKTVKISLAY